MIELKNYAFTRLKEIDINDKIIIYVTTTKLCDFIAKELNCLKYYANFDDKENYFKLFKNDSKYRLMVATNALGLGIDLYFIREVIHIFKQYKIIDYFQEGGRAARDNNKGVNTLFIRKESYAKSINIDGTENEFELFEKIDKNELIKYINEPVCRRRILENYFNNNVVSKCENHQELCDLCEKNSNIINEKFEIEQDSMNSNTLQLIYFENKFIQLSNYCSYCLIIGNINGVRTHKLIDCKEKSDDFNKFLRLNEEFRYLVHKNKLLKRGSCCFSCFLPEKICHRLKNDEGEENANCFDSKLIINYYLTLLILGNEEANLNIDSFPTWPSPQKTLHEYVEYFNKKIDFFNTDAINAIDIINHFNIDNYINNYQDSDEDSDDNNDANINQNIDKNIHENIHENIDSNIHENIDSNIQENISENNFKSIDSSSDIFDIFDDLLQEFQSINLEKIEKQHKTRQIKSRIIRNIEYLFDNCLFCKNANDSNYNSHASNDCDLYKNQFKKYYAKSKDFNRYLGSKHKELNNYENICSNCFLPFNICFFLRQKFGDNKRMLHCVIWEEMAVFYQIIYQ